MEVNGVNPCSEQALEDYGNCCLGNVNLSMFVKNAFEEDAAIEWEELEKAFRYSVRFLDDILDYNIEKHPLSFQTKASLRSRRIGVGFTGLGDMLAKLNIKYDTDEGIKFTDELFEHVKNIVYEASSDLAKEKGTFPVFDLKTHIANPFVKSMRDNVMSKIKKQGLRNACILTVRPSEAVRFSREPQAALSPCLPCLISGAQNPSRKENSKSIIHLFLSIWRNSDWMTRRTFQTRLSPPMI